MHVLKYKIFLIKKYSEMELNYRMKSIVIDKYAYHTKDSWNIIQHDNNYEKFIIIKYA